MGHNIFGDRFTGSRTPAWHSLGTVFTDSPTAEEAVVRSNMDYTIHKSPLLIAVPVGTEGTKNRYIKTDRFGLWREKTSDDAEERFLGMVGINYTYMQNRELARALDATLVGTDEGRMPLETIGCLGDGETIFFCLDAGTEQVGGEDIRQYFLITDTRNGGASLNIAYTPVRVVCQNTLVCGLQSAVTRIELSHKTDLKDRVARNLKIAAMLKASQTRTLETMRTLTVKQIVDEQVDAIINAAYTEPKKPRLVEKRDVLEALGVDLTDVSAEFDAIGGSYAAEHDKTLARRAAAKVLYQKINDEHNAIAGTPWAVYNAVVEVEDYRRGRSEASAAESTLWGIRSQIKARAFGEALAIARS